MTPPHISPHVSEHEAVMHRFITPTARVASAAVILVMGLGIASIFWKMPSGNGTHHALFAEGMVDQNLAATPLPCESLALLSHEERTQISLPTLDIGPVAGVPTGMVVQIYEPPLALLALHTPEPESVITPVSLEAVSVSQQRFEPMRHVVEKPILVEPACRDFPSKPTSVSTVETSDELLTLFQFAENSLATVDESAEPEPPSNPFPVASAESVTVAMPTLQPLTPIQFGNLAPLTPLTPLVPL